MNMNNIIPFVKLDFNSIKPYSRSIYVFALIVVFIGITNESAAMTFTMLMVGMPMILSFPFAISEKNHLDILYSTISLNRKDVVIGRYAFVFVSELIAIVALIAFAAAKSKYTESDMVLSEALIYLSFLSLLFSIIIAFQYPLFFKLGYTKAKLYTYIPVILLFFFVGLLPSILAKVSITINWNAIYQAFMEDLAIMVIFPLLAGIIILLISCRISIKIYENKDI
jgi:ABC-2 type transport system permease protein